MYCDCFSLHKTGAPIFEPLSIFSIKKIIAVIDIRILHIYTKNTSNDFFRRRSNVVHSSITHRNGMRWASSFSNTLSLQLQTRHLKTSYSSNRICNFRVHIFIRISRLIKTRATGKWIQNHIAQSSCCLQYQNCLENCYYYD